MGGVATTTSFKVLPKISGFTPSSGHTGATVTIGGSGFGGATTVKLGTRVAAFTVDSPTQITATVPAAATSGRFSVTTPSGTATSAATFTVTH